MANDPLDASVDQMQKIADLTAEIAANLKGASNSLTALSTGSMGGSGASQVGGDPSAQGLSAGSQSGNVGSAPPTGMRLASITTTTTGGGGGGGGGGGSSGVDYGAGGGGGASIGKSGFKGYSKGMAALGGPLVGAAVTGLNTMFRTAEDLRVGAGEALSYEHSRLMATASNASGNFYAFDRNILAATNRFNVQDRDAFAQQGAMASINYAGLFGGGDAGQRAAIGMLGGYTTMGSMAGISQEASYAAMNSMQSTEAFYGLMAMGVQTRDPITGEPLGLENITNQIMNNIGGWGLTPEQMERELSEGSMLRAALEQTLGAEGTAVAMSSLKLAAKQGAPLKEGALEQAGLQENLFGTSATQGKDALTRLEQSKLGLTVKDVETITTGVSAAADSLADIRDFLIEQDGLFGKARNIFNTWQGGMDLAAGELPSAGSTVKALVNLAGLFFSEGSWNVSKDQMANIHQGEMILPARVAESVRTELRRGAGSSSMPPAALTIDNFSNSVGAWNLADERHLQQDPKRMHLQPGNQSHVGGNTFNVTINVSVANASDREAVTFAKRVKGVLEEDRELLSVGRGRL